MGLEITLNMDSLIVSNSMQEVEKILICGRCGSGIKLPATNSLNPPIYCSSCGKRYGITREVVRFPFCSLCFHPQYVYSYNRTDYSNIYCTNSGCNSYHFTITKDRRSCRLYRGTMPLFRLELRAVPSPQLYFKASGINCFCDNPSST